MDPRWMSKRLIWLVTAGALAVSSLFAQWSVLTIGQEDLRELKSALNERHLSGIGVNSLLDTMLLGVSVPVTGLDGHLPLVSIRIPLWLPIGAVITGIFFTITNLGRLSAIPRKLVLTLLAAGLIAGGWAGCHTFSEGFMDIGGFLLVAASVIGVLQRKPIEA